MSKNSSSSSGGVGFIGLLTIVLIALKLTHQIDISWWWVFSPVIFCVLLVAAILGGVLAFIAVCKR